MREKIIAFFCDIRGTYHCQNENFRNEKIQDMIMKIENLSDKLNCDKVIFSFISNDNKEAINPYLEEFASYNKNKIIMGKQFYEDGYVKNGKIYDQDKLIKGDKIEKYTKELFDEYDVEKVIFADDAKFYVNTAKFFFDNSSIPFDYHIIEVTEGLSTIIKKLDELIDEKNDQISTKLKLKR